MSIFDFLFRRKQSEARMAIAFQQMGRAVPTPKNYDQFIKESYQKNVIAFKCVQLIAKSVGNVPWIVYSKRESMDRQELEGHPLHELLKQPNPMQGQAAFFEAMAAFYMLSGNSYIECVGPTEKTVNELWPIRPDQMRVVPGAYGMPKAYVLKAGTSEKVWAMDPVTGEGPILHMKTFHPTDIWYGMSPIEAAVYSVDQHNFASEWNLSLLQNMGAPSGAIQIKQDSMNPMAALTEPQRENLKEQIQQNIAGRSNAARVMILEGGMEWKAMGFSPKDMDWIQGRNTSARDIALAFGVPPLLLNIPGDSTFSNYKEARLSFYEDTLIPLMSFFRDELNKWLTPKFGENVELDYDADQIPALQDKRAERFTTISSAGFLTVNEKRAAAGYDAIEGGDVLLVGSGQVTLTDLTAEPEEVESETPGEGEGDEEPENQTQDENERTENEPDADADEQLEQSHAPYHTLVEALGDMDPTAQRQLKQINRLNRREKLATWREVNRKRDRLSQAFEMDMREELEAQAKLVSDSLKTVDFRLAEISAIKTITDTTAQIEKTLKKHIERSIRIFGRDILDAGKDFYPVDEVKLKSKFDQFVDRWATERAADAAELIQATNVKRARHAIREAILEGLEGSEGIGEIANRIQTDMSGMAKTRATTIARTEVAIASNQGSLEAAKELEVPNLTKEWVAVNDHRTRGNEPNWTPDMPDHAGVNGATVGINDKFEVGPDSVMDGPCDPSAPVDQIINCRCTLVFSRGD
jgi:HK97 family phage portal protein